METTAADTAPGSEGTEHEHQGTAAPGAGAVYMGSGWLFFWGGVITELGADATTGHGWGR